MLAFDTKNRMSTFALYNNLRNIMNLLDSAQQMLSYLKSEDYIFKFHMKHDWFAKDFEEGKFKYKKIKEQCCKD